MRIGRGNRKYSALHCNSVHRKSHVIWPPHWESSERCLSHGSDDEIIALYALIFRFLESRRNGDSFRTETIRNFFWVLSSPNVIMNHIYVFSCYSLTFKLQNIFERFTIYINIPVLLPNVSDSFINMFLYSVSCELYLFWDSSLKYCRKNSAFTFMIHICGLTIKFANSSRQTCYIPHCWISLWSPSKYSPWEVMHRCQCLVQHSK
jgi:hypothetical protein